MKNILKRNLPSFNSFVLSALILALQANHLHAAPTIDSGSIQRDIENLNTPNLPPPAKSEEPQQATPKSDTAISVKVTGFQFVGAKLLPDSVLQAEVQSYIGLTLDYNGLTKVTQRISQLYQQNGWLAKVFLPPQDIQNGLVTIEINEAKLGEVRTSSDAKSRLNPELATRMLAKAQQKGEPLSSQSLERALLLINDTPGFNAQATLSQGAETGETDVTLNLADTPLFNARVWADNYGSRLLGKARLNGLASFNNLTGWGDQLTVNALMSKGVEYVQGAYEFPVGDLGTRIQLAGSVSNYEVNGGGLSALNPEGESYSYRLGVKHPIIRSRYSNLAFQGSAESFNSKDDVLGLEVSDKDYRALTLGLRGDHSDNIGLGGTLWGGVSVTSGDLDLSGNSADLASDRITRRSDGRYNKINFYLGRQQILGEKLIAKALFSGQLADANLGGYEKFSLGGPFGLAGYTVGEGAADQGWMLNLEAKYAITSQFSASLLGDTGGVCQFKNTWTGWNAGNPKLENCYQLASVGFGLGYANQYLDAKLSYGRQITSNRGLDSNGNDTEGENSKHQLWLQVGTSF
ncbi:MAG: ShlB/FhaC/HecB family hemolysin secretion/activation protein [Pseudomonadota bacterium]